MVEDDIQRKTTFHGRRPSIGCKVYYLKKMFTTPHLDSHNTTDPNQKSYQLSKPEKEFHMMEEIYVASRMHMCEEKTTLLGKDD